MVTSRTVRMLASFHNSNYAVVHSEGAPQCSICCSVYTQAVIVKDTQLLRMCCAFLHTVVNSSHKDSY
eukprot:3134-Heterococcus_DN1.PRE.1